MSKCTLFIHGTHLVGDTESVFRIFEALNEANLERVDYDYIPKADSPTGESQSMYYTVSVSNLIRIESLDPEEYAVWKLYASTRKDKK